MGNMGTRISYDDLVNDISVRLGGLPHPPSSEICIYRVPEHFRKFGEDVYTPKVVSIGPYHHGNKNFLFMENYKWTYFQAFIEWSEQSGVSLNRYVKLMKDSEKKARGNYADTIEMTSDEFVKMMLVDACFILEFVERCNQESEGVFSSNCLFTLIYYDLILLENQIPFFILESIYHLAVSTPDSNDQLRGNIRHFFKSENKQNKSPDFGTVKHFADLIREFYLPLSRNTQPHEEGEIKFVYTATQLHEAGVKFKVGSSECLLDIQFIRGVLEFPCLMLQGETKRIFRNLIALEAFHYWGDAPIMDYAVFMDSIIDTPDDVDLLVRNGMLYYMAGSTSAAAATVNYLCKEIPYYSENSYLLPLCKDLNAYCNRPMNRWKAALKHDYFNTPWRTAATIAAIMLLLLTAIQTVCSLISVVQAN